MRSGLTFRENAAWTLYGKSLFLGAQWLIVVLLAKLGTPDMVGYYGLALGIAAPVFLFSNLQLRVLQATGKERWEKFGVYFGLRVTMSSLAIIFILAVIILADYAVELSIAIAIIVLAKFVESLSDVHYGLFQRLERLDLTAKSQILRGLVGLALVALGLVLTGKLLWALAGLVVAWALVFVFFDFPRARAISRQLARNESDAGDGIHETGSINLAPKWDIPVYLDLVRIALPLGFVMALGSLNANAPIYFVENYLSPSLLGVYAALAYIMQAGATLMSALWEPATPRLARYANQGQRNAFWMLITKLMIGGTIVGVAGVVFAMFVGEPLLRLVYGGEYAAQNNVFVILMVVVAVRFVGGVWSIGVTAMRKFWVQVPINSLILVATVVASIVLIPPYGLVGAAYVLLIATILSRLCFAGALIIFSRQIFDPSNGSQSSL